MISTYEMTILQNYIVFSVIKLNILQHNIIYVHV